MSDLHEFVEFDKVYELNIGKSFQNGNKSTSHHQFKCNYSFYKFKCTNFKILTFQKDDFTPASIDKNQEAKVNIGANKDVVIQMPHVDVNLFKY
jgi:hypothetical protein